jgi:tetratricopeptide (TPR) repeat protein
MATVAELFALAWQHQQAGDVVRAEQFYRQALRHDPNSVEAHNNLGNTLLSQGKVEAAVAHWQEALRIRPDSVEAQVNLGGALVQLGRFDEALAFCEQAVRQRPDLAEALNNLGNALAGKDQFDRAVACYREALRVNPQFALAYNNFGNALIREDRIDEAIDCYQRAIQLKPGYAEAYSNLGNACFLSARFYEAQACYDQSLRLEAGDPDTHFNQALLWLLQEKWDKGWVEYDWRWRTKGFPRYNFAQPRWDGSPPAGGKNTLLWLAEQGLGDTMHFVRYASLAQERGWKILLQSQAPLARLLTGIKGIDQVLPQNTPLPPFDAYLPLLSLSMVFGTLPATVPVTVPYLHANAALVERWRQELKWTVDSTRWTAMQQRSAAVHRSLSTVHRPPFKIGIAWQGTPTFRSDRQRSIPLAHFGRLAQVEGVSLISLQKGPGTDQLQAVVGQFPVLDLGNQLDEASGAFMDTAAIMKNLDLVITSDTAVAHLAGALGVPVWVALPLVPDWRWLLQRPDSPWYPTMRLFRQTRYGHWDDVFDQMAAELRVLATDETWIKHG